MLIKNCPIKYPIITQNPVGRIGENKFSLKYSLFVRIRQHTNPVKQATNSLPMNINISPKVEIIPNFTGLHQINIKAS